MKRLFLATVLGLSIRLALAQTMVPVWVQRYAATGETNNEATAMAVDSAGDVFVTGISYNVGRTADFSSTVAYSRVGTPLWTNLYTGPAATNDYTTAIAVDGAGNVVVTGYSASTNASRAFMTIKYSSLGTALWTNRCSGLGNSCATALAVDSAGNVLVTGYSANSTVYPYNDDFLTLKYSSAGVPLWTNIYNGPGNGDDKPAAIGVDAAGNVFVTGSSIGAGGLSDYLTLAYSPDGVALWTNRYDGTANGGDFPAAIALC